MNKFKYYVGQRWLLWEEDIQTWTKHMIVISKYYDDDAKQIVMIDINTGTPVSEPTLIQSANDDGKTYLSRTAFENIAATHCGFEWKPANKQEQIEYYSVASIGDCFRGQDTVYLLADSGITFIELTLIDIATGHRAGPIIRVKDVNNVSQEELLELCSEQDELTKISR